MKKNRLFVSLLASGMLCLSPAMADDVVKLTTGKAIGESVTLQVNQLKKGATVDWGDGNAVAVSAIGEKQLTIEGQLKGQTVTITSPSKITLLVCDAQGITGLDLSGATNLLSLYCQNNDLTALSVSACKNLRDLNCANNKLATLAITTTTNPNLENLNISGNGLKNISGSTSGTTLSYSSSNLQHLNFSNNAVQTYSPGSTSKNIDVLRCDGNNLSRLALTGIDSLSVLTCNDNKLTALTLRAQKPTLRQIFAQNNQLTTLSLANATGLDYAAIDNNQLTSVTLPEAQDIYAYTCANNKLNLSALPSRDYVKNIIYAPQELEDIDISKALTLDKTTGIYYALAAPTKNDAKKSPYLLDFTDWFFDGSGSKLSYSFKATKTKDSEETTLKRNTDFYMNTLTSNYGKVGFYSTYNEVYFTVSSSDYPDLEQRSMAFAVVNSASDVTGIDDVVASSAALDVKGTRGAIVMTAGKAQTVSVVDAGGRLVWKGQVEGTVTLQQPSGVYIVNGKKVVI